MPLIRSFVFWHLSYRDQLLSLNSKQKCSEIKNSHILRLCVFWVVWWSISSYPALPGLWLTLCSEYPYRVCYRSVSHLGTSLLLVWQCSPVGFSSSTVSDIIWSPTEYLSQIRGPSLRGQLWSTSILQSYTTEHFAPFVTMPSTATWISRVWWPWPQCQHSQSWSRRIP